jgi:hypothetical protein
MGLVLDAEELLEMALSENHDWLLRWPVISEKIKVQNPL